MLDKLSRSDFLALVDQRFTIAFEGETVTATLVEATAMTAGRGGGQGREPFSLVFRVPARVRCAQGTFEVRHDALGALPIFLVPIGPDDQGMRYEAVFT